MNNFKSNIKQQILLWICCFSFLGGFAQPASLSNQAEMSVLTCGIGDEMYTLFGHTALRVSDPAQNLDVVYNWGMFDFRTPNFYSKFVKGNLLYYLDVDRFSDFLYSYTLDNREVVEQVLDLSEREKEEIWTEINRQLKDDDRYYTYGFIRNNCTTKVVDVINKSIENPLVTNFPSNNYSYRYLLNEGLSNHYFEKLGINLLFGYPTNKKSDLMFLPVKLKEGISYNKVLKSEKVLNTIDKTQNKIRFNSIYTLWALVVVFAFGALNRKIQLLYFLVVGLFSVFLLIVSLYTHHAELHFNMLILFYNPLFFIGLLLKNKKLLWLAIALSCLSLFFFGFELIRVAAPLIVLNLIYIVVLFLYTRSKKVTLHA